MFDDYCLELIKEKRTVHDYSKNEQLRKLVNDTFKAQADMYAKINADVSGSCLRGPYAKKRKKAVLANMERVRTQYSSLHLRSIEERFAEFEALSLYTYHYIDTVYSIVAGASIWILDQLKLSGKLYDAFDLMPEDAMAIFDTNVPFDISHPLYDFELIHSAAHMIIHRNGGRSLLDEGKRNENFDKLLSLIDQEKLEHACMVFEEKQWDIIGRVLKLAEFFEEEENANIRRLESYINPNPLLNNQQNRMSEKEALELAGKIDEMTEELRWIQIDIAERLYMTRKELVKSLGKRHGADILQGFTIDDPYEICMGFILLLDNGSDAPWLMRSGTALMQCAVKMLPWYFTYVGDEFGDEEDQEFDDDFEEMQFNRNDWIGQPYEEMPNDPYHTRFGKSNIAQIVYRLSKGVIPFNMHPFAKDRMKLIEQGMDAALADKIECLSEILFFDQFQSSAVNLSREWLRGNDPEEADEADEADETADGSETKTRSKTGKSAGNKSEAGYKAEAANNSGEKSDETETEISAELQKARKEIKNLRKALSEVTREANSDKAKYEHEIKTLRQEHRELADLRELIFNRERNEHEETTEPKVNFPYLTKKRTVVFGGHDNFLKSIKPLLPEVRFVNVNNYAFNPEVIRNAEVVWVQNNYISHAQYWKILNITRQYGIQLRYFKYASAEKSAEQLAEEDKK